MFERIKTALAILILSMVGGGGLGLLVPDGLSGDGLRIDCSEVEGTECYDQHECQKAFEKCAPDNYEYCYCQNKTCHSYAHPDGSCPGN